MLSNIFSAEELRGLAIRKAKPDEYRSVRNPLVDEEVAKGWTIEKKHKTTTRLYRQKTHDSLLEDRVWILMYRMGFKILSGEGGAFILITPDDPKSPENQLDVVAVDDEVAFVIECKSGSKPRKFDDFSRDLAKHVAHRANFTRYINKEHIGHAKRPTIFAFWTSNIIVTEADSKRAEAEHVPMFNENDLEYYEDLVNQIGLAARFQFLADVLEGRQIPGLEITVPAIRTRMGPYIAYTFSVSPEYLLKIAFVSHRAKGQASDIDAYQRMLKKGRLGLIKQYISEGGIFPTNIVVNINKQSWLTFDRSKQESKGDGKSSTFGWLHIRPSYRVAWIIDGQHRLFAYANHPLSEKSLVSVMAFVELPASEQARLFVDINAKQKKVKQSLLRGIVKCCGRRVPFGLSHS